jgi:hypothetical protein
MKKKVMARRIERLEREVEYLSSQVTSARHDCRMLKMETDAKKVRPADSGARNMINLLLKHLNLKYTPSKIVPATLEEIDPHD